MIHNQLSHGAELQNGIASAVGLSRELEGVVRLGETLEPNIDPWSQPEWAYLRAERLGAGFMTSPAVPLEFGMIAFGNPLGSGVLVVVEAVSAFVSASMQVRLEVVADTVISGTMSAAATFVSGRDRRWGSTIGRLFTRTGSDTSNTFGVVLETRSVLNTVYEDYKSLPMILKPGDDLLVIGQTVNITLTANIKWRERKAFNGEL